MTRVWVAVIGLGAAIVLGDVSGCRPAPNGAQAANAVHYQATIRSAQRPAPAEPAPRPGRK